MARYHYCSYWGTWSRRLIDNLDLSLCDKASWLPGPIVEVNLTPIGDCRYSQQSAWDEEVAPVIVRSHCTASSGRDEDVDELPQEVIDNITHFLGVDFMKRLLADDFMSQIDEKKLSKHPVGGARLDDIRKR
jgi:hypothetical protein